MEEQLAAQLHTEAGLEAMREQSGSASEHLGRVQAGLYQVAADIARVEQQLRHNQETAQRLLRAQGEVEHEHGELHKHLCADRQQRDGLRVSLAEDELRLAEWQQRHDACLSALGESRRAGEVERTRIDYLERQAQDLKRRGGTLEAEQKAIQASNLEALTVELDQACERQQKEVTALDHQLDQYKRDYGKIYEAEQQCQQSLDMLREQFQTLSGRKASLDTLQSAALGQEERAGREWLENLKLAHARRLGASLRVESGWERAVETVLAGWRDGVLVKEPLALIDDLPVLGEANMSLWCATEAETKPMPRHSGSMCARPTSAHAVAGTCVYGAAITGPGARTPWHAERGAIGDYPCRRMVGCAMGLCTPCSGVADGRAGA